MKISVHTGTSGWTYKHWKNTFYPAGLKEKQLVFYANEFKTVELNYSFYRVPADSAYSGWYDVTPSDFTFSIKMNRYFTHIKRLITDDEMSERLENFMNGTQLLKEKLEVILIQLHPRQEMDIDRLDVFLKIYSGIISKLKFKPSACIEFRNKSWFVPAVYEILRKYNTALVFPSTPDYRHLEFTSDFAYIRIHGNKSYSDEELNDLKNEIESYPADVKKVFVYFNNDWNTYAIYNARTFISLL